MTDKPNQDRESRAAGVVAEGRRAEQERLQRQARLDYERIARARAADDEAQP